jgi:hypothetical protein
MYADFGGLVIASRNNAANGGIYLATASDGGAQVARLVVRPSGNIAIGTNTGTTAGESNFRLDIAASGSSGTLRAYDQTPTTGATQVIVRAGAGQSTTNLTTWQNAAGSSRLLVTSSLGLVALGTFLSVQDSAGTINRAIIQSTMDVNSSYSFNFSSTTDAGGAKDLSLSRASANTLQVGDGGANANGIVSAAGYRMALTTPASASATGTTGTIVWDADYIYVATGLNQWKRVAIATW